MSEAIEQSQKPDAVEYARIMLYQLAYLRAELVEVRNLSTVIVCDLKGESHAQYMERISGQAQRIDAEVDRIYRVSLAMANIPYKSVPTKESQNETE